MMPSFLPPGGLMATGTPTSTRTSTIFRSPLLRLPFSHFWPLSRSAVRGGRCSMIYLKLLHASRVVLGRRIACKDPLHQMFPKGVLQPLACCFLLRTALGPCAAAPDWRRSQRFCGKSYYKYFDTTATHDSSRLIAYHISCPELRTSLCTGCKWT